MSLLLQEQEEEWEERSFAELIVCYIEGRFEEKT